MVQLVAVGQMKTELFVFFNEVLEHFDGGQAEVVRLRHCGGQLLPRFGLDLLAENLQDSF